MLSGRTLQVLLGFRNSGETPQTVSLGVGPVSIAEVVAVARGEHLSATQSQGGLRLRTPTEDVIAPLTAVAHVGDMVPPLAPEDIVIVATKVHQVAAVLTELAAASTAIGSGLGACPTVPSPTQCPMQQ